MNLKVLVCVKQTFDTEAKIELKDGKISDAGINLIINPYDEVAVEGAIQLKEKGIASEVVVVSAGSDKAMDAIRTALAMGADRGILIKQDTGADEYARAVAIAEVIRSEDPNLVLAGHVAADDGSSQVPTRIAEILGWPHINVITSLEIADGKVRCSSEADGGSQVTEVKLPAVISCQVSWNEPRYPSMKGIMQAKKKPVATVDAVAVENKTRIIEYFLPQAKQAGVKVEGEPEECAAKLADFIKNTAKIEVKA
ncbi:electron transfer flavoprotein subunit beta/FixA family protein [Thermosyntropha lipolytica]|uniref:electron transfer flavoprotein subunit beta/FixA family protein n=1 Tax=Thermosyntropha lipolytica TaxID=54294 RepID=UPI0009FE2C01|nr:electron transfer flavoprotein subunit beta/FixA family protein [Thermosyntropha lipolytica]